MWNSLLIMLNIFSIKILWLVTIDFADIDKSSDFKLKILTFSQERCSWELMSIVSIEISKNNVHCLKPVARNFNAVFLCATTSCVIFFIEAWSNHGGHILI